MTKQTGSSVKTGTRTADNVSALQLTTCYKKYICRLVETLNSINKQELCTLLKLIQQAHSRQHTVFIAGNGGSASTASHWATDLGKGLHYRNNMGIRAFSLADNVSWISATANDIDYDSVFSDQLRAHGKKGDLLISISASGNSPNIIHAIEYAKTKGITTLSIVGFCGGRAKCISDYLVHIPTAKGYYGLTEDVQLILNHFLCDYLAQDIL